MARAMRMVNVNAASLSSARSASTFCISGCWFSTRPKAERIEQWCSAWDAAMRMTALEPIMHSKRVMLTISMMLRTPRPSSPTIQARVPRSSVSDDALEALPIFFLRRSTCIGFLAPSGRQRGNRKHERPPGAWASTRNASHMGADTKYLCPTSS